MIDVPPGRRCDGVLTCRATWPANGELSTAEDFGKTAVDIANRLSQPRLIERADAELATAR